LVGAALKRDSIPTQALLHARHNDLIAISDETEAEIIEVLNRPKFLRGIEPSQRALVLALLIGASARFTPSVPMTDCRDAKDNKYLELALAAAATIIVSSDDDLLYLSPWRHILILRPANYLAKMTHPRE
jgi:putative PIN family toxin of toxin-antitoxin system